MDTKVKLWIMKIRKTIMLKPYASGVKALLVFIAIPTMIIVAYMLGDYGYVVIHTSITAGDLLGFYGSILALIGTLVLGGLAFWQNNKANEINNRLLLIEENAVKPILRVTKLIIDDNHEKSLYHKKNEPKILAYDLNLDEIGTSKYISPFYIQLQFINATNNVCYAPEVISARVKKDFEQSLNISEQYFKEFYNCIIEGSEIINICFLVTEQFITGFRKGDIRVIEIDIQFNNFYGEMYVETVEFGLRRRFDTTWQTSRLLGDHTFYMANCSVKSKKYLD